MKSKNVVIIGSAFPFRGGGISTYNERLARAYQLRGDKVIIYTFSLQYPSFLFPGKTQLSTENPPTDLDIRIEINSINPLNWICKGLKIKKINADLIVIRYWIPFMAPCLGTIARMIRKNKNCRIIAITDNIIPHENMLGSRFLSKYFIKNCDAFLAMSQSVLNDLSKFDTNKPRIYSPHPLYDNFGSAISKAQAKEKLNLNPEIRYILFFGFIREYKGLDLLIEAFADHRFRNQNIQLLVAGEFYIDPKPYLNLIEKLNLKNEIMLHTHFIDNQDVVNYFCASDIVAQPYKDATQSGVTQIAYHFDKPMLTTNVGGLSEMIPDGKVGYVVEPNKQKIADALFHFFDQNMEATFTKNTAIEKLRFSWQLLLERIDQVAEKVRKK